MSADLFGILNTWLAKGGNRSIEITRPKDKRNGRMYKLTALVGGQTYVSAGSDDLEEAVSYLESKVFLELPMEPHG
jgi:hypothetical protein